MPSRIETMQHNGLIRKGERRENVLTEIKESNKTRKFTIPFFFREKPVNTTILPLLSMIISLGSDFAKQGLAIQLAWNDQ